MTESLQESDIILQNFIKVIQSYDCYSQEEKKEKLEGNLNVIICFILENENENFGVGGIKFVYENLLHLMTLEEFWYKAGDKTSKKLLQHIKSVTNNSSNNEEYEIIENSIVSCQLLLNYLTQKANGNQLQLQHFQEFPLMFLEIYQSMLNYTIQRKSYENYSQHLLSIQSSVIELLSLLLNVLKEIQWMGDFNTQFKVCKSLVNVSTVLLSLKELKASLQVWKCFTFLMKSIGENEGRNLNWSSPISALESNIKHNLREIQDLDRVDATANKREDAKLKLIQFSGFYLKIIIAICNRNKDCLNEAFKVLVPLILNIYEFRYTCVDSNYNKLDVKNQNTLNQLLIVGTEELLSLYKNDKDFAPNFSDIFVKNVYTNGVGLLMFLLTVIKQILACGSLSSDDTFHFPESSLLQMTFTAIEQCHVELSLPLMLPGFMFGGFSPEDTSLYAYVVIYISAYVSILDQDQFRNAEKVLFNHVFSDNYWKSQVSVDVICFIGRFGSGSLCESHCSLVLESISTLPSGSPINEASLILLSRLLSFLTLEKRENILQSLIEKNSDRLFISEIINKLTKELSPPFQSTLDTHLLQHSADKLTSYDFESPMNDLIVIASYCGSAAVKLLRTDEALKLDITTKLMNIIKRIQTTEIKRNNSMNAFFCQTLRAIIPLISSISMENIFVVLYQCDQVASVPCVNMCLVLRDLMSSFAQTRFDDSTFGNSSQKFIQRIIRCLIMSQLPFVHHYGLTAAVAFKNNAQIFEMLMNDCDINKSLQNSLQKTPSFAHVKLDSWVVLQWQNKQMIPPRYGETSEATKTALELLQKAKSIIVNSNLNFDHMEKYRFKNVLNSIQDLCR